MATRVVVLDDTTGMLQASFTVSGTNTPNTLVQRNGTGHVLGTSFIPSLTSVTSAGSGTTTMASSDAAVRRFTVAQIVVLPPTVYSGGQRWWIVNDSASALLTVQASDASAVYIVPPGATLLVTALSVTPTSNTLWSKAIVPNPTTWYDANGNIIWQVIPVASAANYLTFGNNVSGSSPTIGTAGISTDINVNVVPKGAGIMTVAGLTVLTSSNSVAVTKKRIIPQTTSGTTATTLSPSLASTQWQVITALASALTINNGGGWSNGEPLCFRIRDNGTTRAITWNASFYRANSGLTLPVNTTPNKWHIVKFDWNSDDAIFEAWYVGVQT